MEEYNNKESLISLYIIIQKFQTSCAFYISVGAIAYMYVT